MKRTILPCMFLALFLLSACQPTPEETFVANKNNATSNVAAAAGNTAQNAGVKDHIKKEKSYSQGNKLIIDADIIGKNAQKLPILSVEAAPFESGEQLKKDTEALCPGCEVYDSSKFTKEELAEQISKHKTEIFRIQNNLDPVTGKPKSESSGMYSTESTGDDQEEIKVLEGEIKKAEEQYASAPKQADIPKTDYKLKKIEENDSMQLNIKAINGKKVFSLSYANFSGNQGSVLYFTGASAPDEKINEVYLPENKLTNDEKSEYRKLSEMLKTIGGGYLQLDVMKRGERTREYYFTREYEGLSENYVSAYVGKNAILEGEAFAPIWGAENLYAETVDGEMVKLIWTNPSKITGVIEENAKCIAWDKALNIFEKQIG